MVAEINFKSIPAIQSLTVFEGRYWSFFCVSIWSLTVFDEISNSVMTAKDH